MFRWDFFLAALIFTIKFSQIKCQMCAADECPKSFFEDDLVISPDKSCYVINDTVTLSCSGNMGGPGTNVCKGNGGTLNGWVFPSTTCEVFTCNRPIPIGEGLSLSPDKSVYDARETVTYICNQGYVLVGPDAATCDDQDTWNPSTVPMCSAVCNVPTIPNGNITRSGPFYDDDTTQVECDDTYSLESGSSSTISCQDGVWDSIPQCFASCNIPDVSNGGLTTSGPFMHGQTTEVNCDEGYTLDGTPSNNITCQDGLWDPVPNCYGSCYVPVIPKSNVETERYLPHGIETSIHCEAGYSYEQQTTFDVNCNNGTFEGDFPDECYQDCEDPISPSDGTVSDGNRHGKTISYVCNEGFVLNGTESATCTNGTWSSDAPTCYEMIITCEAPENVEEGLVLSPDKTFYNVNEVLKYSCSEGKTLKGPKEATCSESGDWQPPDPPVCHGEMIRGTWSSFFILCFSSLLALHSS